jgi:hypothetical protein
MEVLTSILKTFEVAHIVSIIETVFILLLV